MLQGIHRFIAGFRIFSKFCISRSFFVKLPTSINFNIHTIITATVTNTRYNTCTIIVNFIYPNITRINMFTSNKDLYIMSNHFFFRINFESLSLNRKARWMLFRRATTHNATFIHHHFICINSCMRSIKPFFFPFTCYFFNFAGFGIEIIVNPLTRHSSTVINNRTTLF